MTDRSTGYVRGVVARTAEATPDAVAVAELDGRSWTFAELAGEVERWTAEIPAGARRVAVQAANDNDSVARMCAVWQSGASVVLLGALLPDAEAQRRVSESFSDAVLGRAGVSAGLAPGGSPAESDEALVVFTSGTTGRPKGAVLTVDALGRSLEGIASGSGLPPQGRVPADPPRRAAPLFVPMAHMAGALGVLSGWYTGKPVLIVPKFDAKVALRLIDDFGVNILKLTPAMVYDLVQWPDNRDLGAVRSVAVGTAAIPDSTREDFEKRYGVPVLRNYGQTEFSGAIAFERLEDVKAGRRPPGTVGRIAPGVDVRIVAQGGRDLGSDEVGEIVARGGGSMLGYIGADGRPTAPSADGWIHTGDLGSIDDHGFLSVLGRVQETILCGGFNIYPKVVEAALNKLAGVVDSAVAGKPDDRLGEVPVAVVVARQELPPFEDLCIALREELAAYEVPRRIVRVTALPRTENGKIDRTGVVRYVADGDLPSTYG